MFGCFPFHFSVRKRNSLSIVARSKAGLVDSMDIWDYPAPGRSHQKDFPSRLVRERELSGHV
jgi:hypothetical protein